MPGLADAGMTGHKSALKFLSQVSERDQAVLLLTICPGVGDVDVHFDRKHVVARCWIGTSWSISLKKRMRHCERGKHIEVSHRQLSMSH